MTEKIISEINLDLVFKCNEFSQFSNKLKDSKNKLIFESNFWEKVFLSWIKIILKKDASPSFIKIAMRNMVRKGAKSISHFSITFLVLIGILILVATLGKPNIPV